MLALYIAEHFNLVADLFYMDMVREKDGKSSDPALSSIFTRIWKERKPQDEMSSLSCCAYFLVKELIDLRTLEDERFADQARLASVNPSASELFLDLWDHARIERAE